MKREKYPDIIGLSLSVVGLMTSLNSGLFRFIDRLTGSCLPSTLLMTLSIIGLATAIVFAIRPVRSIPLALYGPTVFTITIVHAHKLLYHIFTTGGREAFPISMTISPPALIYLTTALIISISIRSIRGLRSPINIMFSSSFIKLLPLSLLLAIPITYLEVTIMEGFSFKGIGLAQTLTLAILGFTALYIGVYSALGLIVKRSGEGYGKKGLIQIAESYPPTKLDSTDPIYWKVSDLHLRVYRLYKVYRGDLSQASIEELLRRLKKMIIFYYLDGYVYIYLVSEAYRLGKAMDKLELAEGILARSLDVDVIAEEEIGSTLKTVKEATMPRDIPEQIDRDRLRIIVSEENIGLILVYEYGGIVRGVDRFAPRKMYIKSGLYTVITQMGEEKHPTELSCGYRISSAQAMVYAWGLLKLTTPIHASKSKTPLYLRKGRIHMDGSEQTVGNATIKPPAIWIDVPLKHHAFFLGKSRTGKSVGIADTVRYINGNTGSKVIIFDWVGNFIRMGTVLRGCLVVRPGEDIFIDLYRVFAKRELVEMYEEASILFFQDIERASFSPIVWDMLIRAVEGVESHSKLIERVRDIKEIATYKDERDAASAILRRIQSLNPEFYTPIEDLGGDLLQLLDDYDAIIIDLASLNSEGDMILFALACLKVLMKSWSSSRPELYIVIDEAHRLAPKIRGRREWILSRVAREGGKYNIYLILADQTLTSISQDVWNNMGHVFLFHIDNPDDLRMVYPLFSAMERKLKVHGDALREYIDAALRLNQGECFLIRFGGESEPIGCYFERLKLVETGEYMGIDEGRFERALDEIGIDKYFTDEVMKRREVILARRMIRRYASHEVMEKINELMEDGKEDKAVLGGITVARRINDDLVIHIHTKIFLAYNDEWIS